MLMVIFGAGASYDSYERLRPPNVNQYRLPLANDLFDSRFGDDYQLFPKCQALIQRLQRPNVNVEGVLEKFQNEAERYPARRTQLTAVRYYLNYMLSRCQSAWTDSVTKGVTNYQTMVDQIAGQGLSDEEVCLVTFNYDTLLEHAIADSIGVPLNTIPEYVASEYKVIKLHGSTNWAHPITNIPAQRSTSQELISDIIYNAPRLNVANGSYEMVSENPFERPAKPLLPAIAIPVENKQDYECPQEHLRVLGQCLPQVTKLLIIGWRANENLFVDKLAKGISKNARIMVVSGTEAGADDVIARMSARWRAIGLTGDFVASKPEFSNFIFSSEWDDFLKAGVR